MLNENHKSCFRDVNKLHHREPFIAHCEVFVMFEFKSKLETSWGVLREL